MFANLIARYKAASDKRRTLYQLRQLSAAQLQDIGLDPHLVDMGINGWPWRDQPAQDYWMLSASVTPISAKTLPKENREAVRTAA